MHTFKVLLSLGIISLVASSYAQDVTLYESPSKHTPKVISQINTAQLVPFYYNQHNPHWLKVGDKLTGQVGWAHVAVKHNQPKENFEIIAPTNVTETVHIYKNGHLVENIYSKPRTVTARDDFQPMMAVSHPLNNHTQLVAEEKTQPGTWEDRLKHQFK